MFDPRLIVLIAVIAILGFGAFWGFVRKLKKTLVRLVTLLLAFGGAFLLVKLMGRSIGRYIVSLLTPMLGDSVASFLSQPQMATVADALCEMLAAPILFLLSYMVMKIFTWILYKFIVVIFGIKGPRTCGRLSGALVGVLCGVVGLVVFVTPVFGYMTLANGVLDELTAQTQEQTTANVLEEMMETPVAKQAYQWAGKPIFRLLTTVDFYEDKINLEQEVGAIIAIWRDAKVLTGASFTQYGPDETQAIKALVGNVGQSKIVSNVAAYFVSNAAESWVNGEQAFGMSKPNMGDDVQGIADAFFLVFVSTNSETLTQDLGTFADVFELMVAENIFTMGEDNADFVKKLVSGGIVEKLYAVLEANPRMAPVKTAIRDTGVRVMMQQLGLPEDLRATHGDMLEDMADKLKGATAADGSVDQAALSSGIHDVMGNYEVGVSEEASRLIAEAIVENLTAAEIATMTPAQIADKLAERFTAGGQTASLPAAQ